MLTLIKINKSHFLILSISLIFFSCKKDSEEDNNAEPPRDMAEQYIIENDSITHLDMSHNQLDMEVFLFLNETCV